MLTLREGKMLRRIVGLTLMAVLVAPGLPADARGGGKTGASHVRARPSGFRAGGAKIGGARGGGSRLGRAGTARPPRGDAGRGAGGARGVELPEGISPPGAVRGRPDYEDMARTIRERPVVKGDPGSGKPGVNRGKGDRSGGGGSGGGVPFFYGGFWGGPFSGGFYRGPFGFYDPFYDPLYDPFYDPYFNGGPVPEAGAPGESGQKNVEVRVSPKNAEVYVNGVLYSKRGRARFNLPAGTWKIELRAPGHVPQVVELTVEPGVRYTIERRLEKDETLTPEGRPRASEEI